MRGRQQVYPNFWRALNRAAHGFRQRQPCTGQLMKAGSS